MKGMEVSGRANGSTGRSQGISGRDEGWRCMNRQEERCRVAEATRENSVNGDVLGATERVVNYEQEVTSVRELAKGGAGNVTFGQEAFDGARQEDGGFDTGGVITENGNVAL
jgi:hypothetical protein